MAYYTDVELRSLGLARFGHDVKISTKASLYNCGRISLGNHVRIDDFCVLSAGEGGIEIGDYVHIAVFCSVMGTGRITFEDFSGLSSRVSIYSSNDDYSGERLTNPTVPGEFTGVTKADVKLCRHVIVGAGAVILPGVVLHEGAAIGSLSLVRRDCDPFTIYSGVPAKRIAERSRGLLTQERQLRERGD
ncbi:acyltransferase [Ideonella sp. DXS22W]|uniref:Acyltransferase n=1 Tax=Pseudaquabacterium inlustre TaxID=2984192 RepID=A0ABU9CDV8_9BURK